VLKTGKRLESLALDSSAPALWLLPFLGAHRELPPTKSLGHRQTLPHDCDGDKERFEERLAKIAKQKPEKAKALKRDKRGGPHGGYP
jgi:hypothetical protein